MATTQVNRSLNEAGCVPPVMLYATDRLVVGLYLCCAASACRCQEDWAVDDNREEVLLERME